MLGRPRSGARHAGLRFWTLVRVISFKRAEILAVVGASPLQPVRGRRVAQHAVGDRAQTGQPRRLCLASRLTGASGSEFRACQARDRQRRERLRVRTATGCRAGSRPLTCRR